MADVPSGPGSRCPPCPAPCAGSPLVSAATTARVRARRRRSLSFAVSRAASSLAPGKLDRVAVLVSGSLGSWFNGCLLDAIYQTLHDRRQELLIYRTLEPGERDEFFATLPARRNADALIVGSLELTTSPTPALAEPRHAAGLRQPAAPGAASVSIDDAAGAEVATQHLVNLGHRRIGLRGLRARPAATRPSSANRLAGYRAALAAAEVPEPGPAVISTSPGRRRGGVVGQLLSHARAADRPAGGVRRSGHAGAGRALAGGDRGRRRTCRWSASTTTRWPTTFGLTTMAQPVDQLGAQAADWRWRWPPASRRGARLVTDADHAWSCARRPGGRRA